MSSHKRRSYGYGARKLPKNIGKLGEAWAMALQIATASEAPIHEALVPAKLFEVGIGNLFFSRALPDGRIALGSFLLDVFCLGVKNAFVTIVAREEYAQPGEVAQRLRIFSQCRPPASGNWSKAASLTRTT